ncbi:hypothetical protein J7J90_04980 [Candidatus Micrarchaeota archaeon]|nr:hypothetical protein [Candidatus Micrarchaeota archaeon]
MKLPGIKRFFKVKSEDYDAILKVDNSAELYKGKAKKYGAWLAKKYRVSSLLFITELFNELGARIKLLSTSPIVLELPVKKSYFIIAFFEGLFSEVYGVSFKFKVKKSRPLVLEGRSEVKRYKNQFFEIINNDKKK